MLFRNQAYLHAHHLQPGSPIHPYLLLRHTRSARNLYRYLLWECRSLELGQHWCLHARQLPIPQPTRGHPSPFHSQVRRPACTDHSRYKHCCGDPDCHQYCFCFHSARSDYYGHFCFRHYYTYEHGHCYDPSHQPFHADCHLVPKALKHIHTIELFEPISFSNSAVLLV